MSNYVLKYDDYLDVVSIFNSTEDNLASTIGEILGLKTHYVDYLIDVYLSLKNNYSGHPVDPPKSIWNYKFSKRIKVTEDGDLVGYFKSKKECARILGGCINSRYAKQTRYTIKHKNINRTLTYEIIK